MSAKLLFLFLSNTQFFNLPPGVLSGVCYVESKHVVTAFNQDDNGSPSIGICQIKLKTAKWLGFPGNEKDLQTLPAFNIYYSAKYLSYQLNRYHGDVVCAISAYNQGSCKRSLNGKPRNSQYVEKVLKAWGQRR